MKNPIGSKAIIVGVVIVISAAALIVFHRRAHPRDQGEWLRKVNSAGEENLRTNGFVQEGKHAWRLPREAETNAPKAQ